MGQILDIVLPVFGLAALGLAAVKLKILPLSVGDGLSAYVFALAVPALIFRTLSTGEMPSASPWAYWIAYFAGVATVWALAMLAARRLFARDAREAVVHGFSAGQSNTVLFGIPLIVTAYGEAGAVPLFLLIAVHLPIVMATATILMQVAEGGRGGLASLKAFAVSLVANPIIIGIVAGGVARLLGVTAPGALGDVVDMLAASAAPVALVAMGMTVARYGGRGDIGPAVLLTALKLMVHPFIVWVLAFHVLEMPPVFAAVAVLFASLPTGVNAYLVAARYGTGESASSSVVSLTTVASVVTVTFWLWVIGAS